MTIDDTVTEITEKTHPPMLVPDLQPVFRHISTITKAVDDAAVEMLVARLTWPRPFVNAHEGYAVLLEEMDELKEQVWTNQGKRDLVKMRKEAIQVAATALRFVVEVCDDGRGRV